LLHVGVRLWRRRLSRWLLLRLPLTKLYTLNHISSEPLPMQLRNLAGLIAPCLLICIFCVQANSDTAAPLRFLTEHNPPGQYLDQHGQASGVTVELIRILQQRLNEHGTIELLPWARAFEIARTQPNIALFETARSAE